MDYQELKDRGIIEIIEYWNSLAGEKSTRHQLPKNNNGKITNLFIVVSEYIVRLINGEKLVDDQETSLNYFAGFLAEYSIPKRVYRHKWTINEIKKVLKIIHDEHKPSKSFYTGEEYGYKRLSLDAVFWVTDWRSPFLIKAKDKGLFRAEYEKQTILNFIQKSDKSVTRAEIADATNITNIESIIAKLLKKRLIEKPWHGQLAAIGWRNKNIEQDLQKRITRTSSLLSDFLVRIKWANERIPPLEKAKNILEEEPKKAKIILEEELEKCHGEIFHCEDVVCIEKENFEDCHPTGNFEKIVDDVQLDIEMYNR